MKVGTTSTIPTHHAASEVMLPSDELAALLPSGWPPEFPLARVRTCGTLAVEVLIDLRPEPDGRLQAVYGPPAAHLFSMKGMTTALVLLALLASQPGGFASKDFLIQTLAHLRQSTLLDEENDWEDVEPLTRLDNVVSLLRKLLYPPTLLAFSGANRLRKHLVRFVRATQDSGPGYRLARFPLLWLDVEAMETYVARARQLEARGEDGLEEWQAAYQIGMRGAFLAHEPYSDWADWRRGRVADLLWQSVDAQWKRAASWDEDISGREVAVRLLLEFWQAHMTNEDAFRSLVELLGKQERFGQVEECYRQLCAALDREGRLPQKRTQETMTFLRLARDRREGHQQMSIVTSSSSRSLMVEGRDVHLGDGTSQEASAASGNEAEASRILPETRHLIGREAWLRGVSQMVQAFPAKKLVILQGPIGVGKSSELARLAYYFQRAERSSYRVIWLSLPAAEWSSGPETTLDVLLGTLLSECGIASFPSEAPRERLIAAFLAHLKQQNCPTVMLLDNAECLLQENGALAPCWEAFLTRFVRSRHQATFLLATKEWHGWSGRESIFVAETFVPPLSPDESAILLQRLGLDAVPTELLQTVGVQMAGIPLLLEWTARLVADPLLLDDWAGLDESEAILQASTTQESIIGRLQRLLDDPSLLGEHLASRLAPFLQRIVEKRLSEEARLALIRLAVAAVPLGKPALQTLCPRPRLLKELRDASLLAAYTNRVQLLPVVALIVQQQLSAAQRQEAEILAIQAYTRWLNDGNLEMREAGRVVAELTVLLLMHYRLMEAAELLIRLGWLSFQCGYGARLALLAEQVMKQCDWQSPLERWSGGTLLSYLLRPFLGKGIDTQQRTIYYQAIYDFVCTGKIKVRASTEVMLTHYIMLSALNNDQFVEAQQALELCCHRLEPLQSKHISTRASVLGKQGMLLSHWSEYLEDQGEKQAAREKREQAILIYQQFIHLLETHNEPSLLHRNSLKKQHAYALHYLGYHLYKIGHYEKALQSLQQSMALQKQGYGGLRGLSACFGDTILTLAALGRFREALALDEKASVEVRRLADLGHAFAKQECWFHNVNRGCLYLRLGRIEEAEQLLREALPHITIDRRAYRMFAQEALDEIERWRRSSALPHHQLDWRWVERYRSLASYDTYWWLGPAGPLTEEEQREWDQLFPRQKGGDAKEHLGKLMAQSTRRELNAALEEHREPRLSYPTIDIEEVRSRISGLQQLDKEISQEEPNAIVRRLYHDALEEELDTLCLIEAVYEDNSEDFQTLMYRLIPPPTPEEMQCSLVSGVKLSGVYRAQKPNKPVNDSFRYCMNSAIFRLISRTQKKRHRSCSLLSSHHPPSQNQK